MPFHRSVNFRFGFREAVAVIALVILIAVVVSVGFLQGVEEMVDPKISLRIERTWQTNGTLQNITPNEGRVWQVIDVRITNMNEDSSFQVSISHFFAYTDEGEKLWVFNGEDYDHDPIEPGENQTVSLIFHIEENADLVELEYVRKLSSTVSCNIPEPERP